MKTIKGPALFLAQFAGDAAPFNSWDSITRWAADCGYVGVQVPSWDARLPLVRVDPVRIPRALATFVAHALRSTSGGELHVHGSAVPGGVRIDIELPRPDPDLETLLKPNPRRAETQHRGLALGLRLARSVVELHGGTVEIGDRGGVPAVSVLLPEMPGA